MYPIILKNTRHGSDTGNGFGSSIVAIKHPSPGSFIMTKRIEYQKGERVGECIYLFDTGKRVGYNRYAMFRCECGKEFEAAIYDVKSEHTQSCGCYQRKIAKEINTIHGLSEQSIYRRWGSMKKRCENQNSADYKNYGGRGITVCDEWRSYFKAYYDYVMSLPNAMDPGLTIDRIDNDVNYEPGNLRWGSRHIQAANKRTSVVNTSGYVGIHYNNEQNKWASTITVKGKKMWLGYFALIDEAIDARNRFIIENNLNEYSLNTHENGKTETADPTGN